MAESVRVQAIREVRKNLKKELAVLIAECGRPSAAPAPPALEDAIDDLCGAIVELGNCLPQGEVRKQDETEDK